YNPSPSSSPVLACCGDDGSSRRGEDGRASELGALEGLAELPAARRGVVAGDGAAVAGGDLEVDLGMGHPIRTTRPNPPEKNPTRPDPSYVAGGRGPYFLTRNNQRAGHGP